MVKSKIRRRLLAATGSAVDETFMQTALALAVQTRRRRGASRGGGRPRRRHDRQGSTSRSAPRSDRARRDRRAAPRRGMGNYRLTGAELYVTIEPCQMCVGAMIHARIARVVYGTPEPKAGAIESAMRAHEHPALNHRMAATGGVLEDECRAVMQEFFRERRANNLSERYRSGRNGGASKASCRVTGTGVRIPPSPPTLLI